MRCVSWSLCWRGGNEERARASQGSVVCGATTLSLLVNGTRVTDN